jgi:hypothetical protein
MSFNYSPDLVSLLIAERQQEAANARRALRPRSNRGRQWGAPVRRLLAFRRVASPTAQTCSC